MEYSPNRVCHHPTVTLSYPEHELVCTNCGLVTEKRYFEQAQVVDEVVEGEIQIFITDLMCNLHIPLGVRDATFYTYQKFRQDERLSSFNNTIVATFALFDVLNQEAIPKTEHELCYFASIDPHKFWRIQKAIRYEPRVLSTAFVEKTGVALNFPLFLNGDVTRLVEQIQDKSYSKLQTIVGCAFYKVVLDHGLDIPLKLIAQSVNVSKATILSLFKKLQYSL